MPISTSKGTLTTPDGTAVNDVKAHLADLAQQVENTFTRCVLVTVTATTDANGYGTFTHNLGVTPKAVIPINNNPATSWAMTPGSSQYTATTFVARVFDARGGGLLVNASITFLAVIFL